MPIMDGKMALEKIKLKYPHIKVIMISSYFTDSFIVEFVRMGASAFLPKNCDITKVVEAIHEVQSTGYYFDNKVSTAMAKVINHSIAPKENAIQNQLNLTERELQIIKLVSANFSNKEISAKLNISTRTVEGHRANIRSKTGCHTVLGIRREWNLRPKNILIPSFTIKNTKFPLFLNENLRYTVDFCELVV